MHSGHKGPWGSSLCLAFSLPTAAALGLIARPPTQLHLSLDPAAGGAADWAPVVGWRSGAFPSGGAIVQFGLAPDRLAQNASADAYATHPGMGNASFPFATLRGLEPNATYFYRVGTPGEGPGFGFSRVHNLTTPPAAGSEGPTPPWSFLAYGDLGTAPSDHEGRLGQDVNCTTNTTVNADPPGCPDVTLRQLHRREWDGARPGLRHELVLHVGDIVYADWGCNLSTNCQWWDTFGEQIEFLAASKPYLICPGNHDLKGRTGPGTEPGASRDLESLRYNARYRMPARAGTTRTAAAGGSSGRAAPSSGSSTTPGPGPERYYYAYSHRNVRFVSISTEHDLSPGSAQYTWLEAELAAADTPSARAKRPWVLLFGHKPPVCSHQVVCGEAAVPLGLLARHHVDLALWGHLHAYERTLPMVNKTLAATGGSYHNAQGTPHVVIGMAGDGFCCGGWSSASPPWSAFREDSFGYARVHVASDEELRLEYVRNGVASDVRDSFTITKDGKRASPSHQRPAAAAVWRPTTAMDVHDDLATPRSHLGYRAHLGSCPEKRAP